MVVIRKDNLFLNWVIDRIVDIFSVKDNKVRAVNEKTKPGIFYRSVSKMAVLLI